VIELGYTVVRNGALIDGLGASPVPLGAVLIQDDRIAAVGHEQDIKLPASPITEVDARGGFILPGFIDTHVHLMFEGLDTLRTMSTPFSLPFYQAIEHMRRTIEAGVTTVRDAGGVDLGVKRAVESGLVVGPRIQISITALTTTGGHGDGWMSSGNEFHMLPAHPGRPDGRCDGPENVRRKVREILRAGAEVIKVHATGGILSTTSHSDFTQFSLEELRAIVEEGEYRRGVKVMAHAHGTRGIKNAIQAGIHSIEHGIILDHEAIELMLRCGTFLVPTMLAMVAILEMSTIHGSVPDWAVRKAREVIEIHRESVAEAYKAGVKICMGTDAAAAPHGSNLGELGLLCDIGMSPMEALVAATRRAAECLGWEDRVGTLEAGKYADLVVTRTDPLDDIGSLKKAENIALVMKSGAVVKDCLRVAN
jgi:imidazolonepropionase-like amidohydrolase